MRMLAFVAWGMLGGSVIALAFGAHPLGYSIVLIVAIAFGALVFYSVEHTRAQLAGTSRRYFDPLNPGANSGGPYPKVLNTAPYQDTVWFSIKPLRTSQKTLAAALVVVGLVGSLIPAAGLISRTTAAVATGGWGALNLQTGTQQQRAIDELIDYVGSPMVVEIRFDDLAVVVIAPSTPGGTELDQFRWTWNGVTNDGPAQNQNHDLQVELFDASALDFSTLGAVVRSSDAASGVESIQSRFVAVSIGAQNPSAGPEIYVSFTHSYGYVYLTYSFDGELLRESTG